MITEEIIDRRMKQIKDIVDVLTRPFINEVSTTIIGDAVQVFGAVERQEFSGGTAANVSFEMYCGNVKYEFGSTIALTINMEPNEWELCLSVFAKELLSCMWAEFNLMLDRRMKEYTQYRVKVLSSSMYGDEQEYNDICDAYKRVFE